jgi:hypothetical protein
MRDVMHKNEYKARNPPLRNSSQCTPPKPQSVDRKARLVNTGGPPGAEGMGAWKAGDCYGSSDDEDGQGRQSEDQQDVAVGVNLPAVFSTVSPIQCTGDAAVTEGQAVRPHDDMLTVNGIVVTKTMLEEVLGGQDSVKK